MSNLIQGPKSFLFGAESFELQKLFEKYLKNNFRKMFREFLHSAFDITDDIIMDRLI